MFVKDQMTPNPHTISPDQTIPDANEIFSQYNVKRLPVVKDNGELVGVVSRTDVSQASPSKATSLSVGEIIYLLAKTTIQQIMTQAPVTISSDALLEEAATLMRDHHVGFLPVVDDGKLVGIITESDIFDAFISLLGFRDSGTRLTIEAEDAPGIASIFTNIIGSFGANLTHIVSYHHDNGKSSVVLGINQQDTTAIEEKLEESGFKILYKLQNP